jgi:hypothetical protein
MFSLRKRAKIEENANIKNNINSADSLVDFSSLPIELLFVIFDFLTVKDLVKLRLLNKKFRYLVDGAFFVWKRIKLNLEFDSTLSNINNMIDFVNHKPLISCLSISCHNLLTKRAFHKLAENNNSTINQEIKLNIKNVNLLSLNILNLFSKNCRQLSIDSFVKNYGEILSSKYKSYLDLVQVNKFKNLNTLHVNCLLHDTKTEKYFVWDKILNENFIFTNFFNFTKRLSSLQICFLNFSFNKESNFFDSLLNVQHLKILKLENCHFYGAKLTNIQKEIEQIKNVKKLENIETLSFDSCSIFLIYAFLKFYLNPMNLKILNIFTKEIKTFVSSVTLEELVSLLNKYYKKVINELGKKRHPNMTKLSTNIFTNLFDQTNYVNFKNQILQNSSLTELKISSKHNDLVVRNSSNLQKWSRSLYDSNLICFKFNMNDFISLFNNVEVNKNIKLFEISFTTNCFKEPIDLLLRTISNYLITCTDSNKIYLSIECSKHKSRTKIDLNMKQNFDDLNKKKIIIVDLCHDNIRNGAFECLNLNFKLSDFNCYKNGSNFSV